MPMKKIKELFIKYKEIIMYLIFGVATTGVNWVVYSLLMKAVLVHAPGSDDVKMTVSNVIAWIAAVIFAFITNKLWVFESKSWVPKVAAREFVSFVVSRLATGVIEWFGPLLLFKIGLDQDLFGVKGFVAKIVCSVLVVILNYVFSKLLVFTKKKKSVYGTVSYGEPALILYLRNVLKFLEPDDLRDETEKDIWELKNLDIEIRYNPIYNVETLDFRKISQSDIREECKKAVFMNLKYEAIGTVQGELTIMRRFSEYLRLEYPKVKSCYELDRDILENFLISLSTAEELHSGNSNYVISLRRQLETIGKIYSYENLGHLFINTDTPPETKAEFRVYSDAEMKRLNAEITRMDVQIARCLLIHQMLGTRISDTLTLRTNCLAEENGQYMVEIYQVKTKRYKKPVSQDLARLLQRSIEYTQEKFQDTKYIFVNEKNPDRPIQYMAIKSKVMSMIQEKQLKDDNGNLFGFGTHMFRHYYGVKLTEMHVDDWTIARLLGHKRLNSVKHYRKMSNQRMADETREVRQMMSDIIYSILDGWGEEYEQIRQDD